MLRKKVNDTAIASVGYNYEWRSLEIEFKDGRVYAYFDVQKSDHEGLMKAKSMEDYYKKNIEGKFTTMEVGEED